MGKPYEFKYLSQPSPEPVAAPAPEPALYGDVSEVLERLAILVATTSELEVERDELVRLARSQGATWARLGEVLGVTHQAVQKRYGGD